MKGGLSMSRTRAFTRYQRNRHIIRKKRIIGATNCYYAKFDGILSKGKVHCSCWYCRRKSYDEIKYSDRKKILALDVSERVA
jgi:hypothetical protein